MTPSEPEIPLTFAVRALGRYFRYQVEGLEHLVGAPTGLIVAYHGRPFSWDVVFLTVRLFDRTGRYPLPLTLSGVASVPWVGEQLGRVAVYGRPDAAAVARARAEYRHFMVAPGGLREALRPSWQGRYTVDFGSRRGYLKLAMEHGLPLYPVVATGVDDAYLSLANGHTLSRRLFGHGRAPIFLGLGVGGVFPFALPIPVRVRQRIGPPIHLEALAGELGLSGDALIEAAHERVTGTMQQMLDALRSEG